MELLRPLQSCPHDLDTKGNRLRTMHRAGLPVPEAYVLHDERGAPNHSEIVAADVRELMNSTFAGVPVTVRGSSADDDVSPAATTGEHATQPGLRTANEVLRAIEQVRMSREPGAGAAMHVLVQRVVPCAVSGVLYTRNPIAEDATMLVEAAEGPGTQTVTGPAARERYTLPRAGGPMTGADWSVAADGLRESLTALGHVLEAQFGTPQDVEWGVHDGRLYVFRSRDIPAPPVDRPLPAARPETSGARPADVVISPGYGIGPAVGDGSPVAGRVVVLDAMPAPGELSRFRDASALIVRAGNALSRSARVARTLGIPAVVANIATPGRELDGLPVLVDAVNGRVTPLLALPPVERTKAIFAALRHAGMREASGWHYQRRYETVLLDPVFQGVVRSYLRDQNVDVLARLQDVLPFDDRSLSDGNIEAQVRTTGAATRVLFRRTDLLPDHPFRFAEEVRTDVETAEIGADLLRSLHYLDRPAHQRRFESARVGGVRLEFSAQPGATCLRLESDTPDAVEQFLVTCGVPVVECAPPDGTGLCEAPEAEPGPQAPDHVASTPVRVAR